MPTNYVNQLSQYGTLVSVANKIWKKRLIRPLDFSSLDIMLPLTFTVAVRQEGRDCTTILIFTENTDSALPMVRQGRSNATFDFYWNYTDSILPTVKQGRDYASEFYWKYGLCCALCEVWEQFKFRFIFGGLLTAVEQWNKYRDGGHFMNSFFKTFLL